jgi:hypothetical protein
MPAKGGQADILLSMMIIIIIIIIIIVKKAEKKLKYKSLSIEKERMWWVIPKLCNNLTQ